MKSKGRFVGQRWWSIRGLPSVFLLCLFFFLAGLFGSTLISHQVFPLLTDICLCYMRFLIKVFGCDRMYNYLLYGLGRGCLNLWKNLMFCLMATLENIPSLPSPFRCVSLHNSLCWISAGMISVLTVFVWKSVHLNQLTVIELTLVCQAF